MDPRFLSIARSGKNGLNRAATWFRHHSVRLPAWFQRKVSTIIASEIPASPEAVKNILDDSETVIRWKRQGIRCFFLPLRVVIGCDPHYAIFSRVYVRIEVPFWFLPLFALRKKGIRRLVERTMRRIHFLILSGKRAPETFLFSSSDRTERRKHRSPFYFPEEQCEERLRSRKLLRFLTVPLKIGGDDLKSLLPPPFHPARCDDEGFVPLYLTVKKEGIGSGWLAQLAWAFFDRNIRVELLAPVSFVTDDAITEGFFVLYRRQTVPFSKRFRVKYLLTPKGISLCFNGDGHENCSMMFHAGGVYKRNEPYPFPGDGSSVFSFCEDLNLIEERIATKFAVNRVYYMRPIAGDDPAEAVQSLLKRPVEPNGRAVLITAVRIKSTQKRIPLLSVQYRKRRLEQPPTAAPQEHEETAAALAPGD